MAVSLDGVMVPMKDPGPHKKAAKPARTKALGTSTPSVAGYREASCATLSLFDAQGERLATARHARMRQANKASLKHTRRADVEAVLSTHPQLRLVKLADGALDNWTYLSEQLPTGDELIDFFHAAEHLKGALDSAYGVNSTKATGHFEKLRHLLRHDDDGVDKVTRTLKYLHAKHPRRERLRQVLG
jgi:hypothetical protein